MRHDGNTGLPIHVAGSCAPTIIVSGQRIAEELAESARDDLVIQRLMDLAADFEEEADRLDGGDAKPV